MKNILTYIVLFLTFNVYGQNNSKIVNLDSINFYFGEKLNAERIKLGKPTVSYNQKLSAVELDWIDNYFQYIIKQEDEIVECMKNRTQSKYITPTMHGTGENDFSHRYNKYFNEKKMASHCDHIQSIFDGEKKGIPILSCLGILNEEYEGGKFIMFEDTEIKFNAGDLIIFPSIFLYPHKVLPVTKGSRYSFISWVY
jgi:hypothetical protein